MSFLQIITLVLIIFLCVYAVVDRVCKCLENRSLANAYEKFHGQKG